MVNLFVSKPRSAYLAFSTFAAVASGATGAALLVPASARAAGPDIETCVMAINGQSTDLTERQPDPMFNNFGGNGVPVPINAVSNPSLLATYGECLTA